MDVRGIRHPVVAGARDALDRFNGRHPWSHNDHFHGWILRHLPERRRAALDVGCGSGLLVERLADRFEQVTGIDRDDGMATAAAARLAGRATVVRCCGFEEVEPPPGGYDLVTMVAVLHHLDLDAALSRVPRLLAPRGRLLVVGLARPAGPSDLALDLVSAVLNPAVGMLKHPRRADPAPFGGGPRMPVQDPRDTVAEVAAAARTHLPGVSVRRRIFFRYTMCWAGPVGE